MKISSKELIYPLWAPFWWLQQIVFSNNRISHFVIFRKEHTNVGKLLKGTFSSLSILGIQKLLKRIKFMWTEEISSENRAIFFSYINGFHMMFILPFVWHLTTVGPAASWNPLGHENLASAPILRPSKRLSNSLFDMLKSRHSTSGRRKWSDFIPLLVFLEVNLS